MHNVNNLPETFEEFGKINGWGEIEMRDKLAPLTKKYYEKMAILINQFEPFTTKEIQVLNQMDTDDIYDYIDASYEYGHISEHIYEECMSTFDEMAEYSDEIFMNFGFIYDLFIELFELYLSV